MNILSMKFYAFQKVSELSRELKLPRIYISANCGARIGLAEEIKHMFHVAWEDPSNVDKVGGTAACWTEIWPYWINSPQTTQILSVLCRILHNYIFFTSVVHIWSLNYCLFLCHEPDILVDVN